MQGDGTHATIEARIRKPSAKLSHVAACIYGRGGVGKTTLLGTMPGKGLVIDVPQVEGGTMVLSDKADKIDVIQVLRWEDVVEVYDYLRNGQHEYSWVGLDTITALQELSRRKTLKERDSVLAGDPHIVSMQDWGKIGALNTDLYFKFRALKLHCIFLAQESLKGSGEDGMLEYQPTVSPASLQVLLPSMFLVGRLYVREVEDEKTKATVVERHLRVGPHDRTVTKVRAVPGRQLPPVIKEPNLGQIFAWLLGAEKSRQPAAARQDDSGIALVEIVP